MSSSSNPNLSPLSAAASALASIPAQGAPTAPPTAAGTAELEHWIYGASPEKGYGTRAESFGLHPPLYLRQLAGHYTPVRVEKTTNGATIVDGRMIHPATAAEQVILSILGRGAADEYNRPTIQNHTVLVPLALLRHRQLSLADVERATLEFDRLHPSIRGMVEPIHVPLREPSVQPVSGHAIHKLMTKPAVDTLATRLMGDPHGRTLLLCRGSSNEARNELLYELIELLCLEAELPMFAAISDAPTLSAMNHFRLAISSRGVRADSSWMLLDASIEKAALAPLRSRASVYGRIAQAFGSP
jgi:hypothetical protein